MSAGGSHTVCLPVWGRDYPFRVCAAVQLEGIAGHSDLWPRPALASRTRATDWKGHVGGHSYLHTKHPQELRKVSVTQSCVLLPVDKRSHVLFTDCYDERPTKG